MPRESNNFKAGLFVILGFALIAVTVVVLTDIEAMFTPTRDATVQFPLSDGLQGLKVGATVTIGDVPAGQVTAINDVPDANDPQVIRAKQVRFEIPEKYKLYDNAQIELVVPPLGAGTKLNIRSFGFDAGESATDADGNPRIGEAWVVAGENEVLRGGIAPSTLTQNFTKDLGIEELQREQIRSIIANVDVLTTALAKNPERIENTVANIEAITAQLKADLPVISANLKKTTEDLQVVLADVRGRYTLWLDRIDAVTKNAETALVTVNGILDENRPVLKSTFAKAESTLTRTDQLVGSVQMDWLPKVNEMLGTADASLRNINASTAELRTFVTAQLPVLERSMANMRLTSDQLKLAAIEVRRSPWRLLYKPTDQELESDNIYDAARSFALAAGALESTAGSLQTIMQQHGDKIAATDPNLKLMLDNLHQTFEKFMEAETRFWDAMQKPAK